MKKIITDRLTHKRATEISVLAIALLLIVLIAPAVRGAVAPPLGAAATFGILANTYTNSGVGTVIIGDLGYTVAPANPPTVIGTIFTATDSTYIAAEAAQVNAIAFLNDLTLSGTCDYTIVSAIDLATYNAGSGVGIYPPGVYCIGGAVTIGAGGITLSGSGVYIFRIDGALGTVATSVVQLTNGADACNVFWVPVGATTLGDDSTFVGIILSDAAFTLGSTVSMTGSILSNGAVTTTGPSDTITSCNVLPPTHATGRMTGGGSIIDSVKGRVTYGFELHCNIAKLPNNLEINWKGNKFHLDTLTSATCLNDPSFSPNPPAAGFDIYHGIGTGTLNGVPGATIDFTFTDHGEPGTSDTTTIIINGGATLAVTGTINNGNIQAHAQ